MTPPDLRILLDEHYPGWLAEALRAAGVDAVAVVDRDDLRGAPDTSVLRAAVVEERTVVTEDVSTFTVAIDRVGRHHGVVFCHHARFPRTRSGLDRLRRALIAFVSAPPIQSDQLSFVWWLAADPGSAHSQPSAMPDD